MVSHLAWPHLPPLALKAHASRGIVRHGTPLARLERDPSSQVAIDKLQQLANASAPGNSQTWAHQPAGPVPPVQEYFESVGDAYRLHMQRHRGNQTPTPIEVVLQAACDRPLCDDCKATAGSAGHTCNWTASTDAVDRQTVEDRGLCVEPIREVFEFCEAIAADAYQSAAGAFYAGLQIDFSSANLGASNAFLNIALDGTTRDAAVIGGGGGRDVTLSIRWEDFNPRDYLASAYVLMHECVAHGHCGLKLASAGANRALSFEDGWMDRIALEILRISASSAAFQPQQNVVAWGLSEFVSMGGEVQARRVQYWAAGAPKEAQEWAAGVLALEVFERLFVAATRHHAALIPAGSSVASEVIKASLLINASPHLPYLTRRDFVNELLRRFESSSEAARQAAILDPYGQKVLQAVRTYLQTRDVVPLVDAVLT
jgi:hypothetical protein